MLENGIGLSASEISILGEPIEFYEQLISNIENAKNNIILSSLYIGNGDKEAKLYNAIEDFLSRGGKALIILGGYFFEWRTVLYFFHETGKRYRHNSFCIVIYGKFVLGSAFFNFRS